jgi:hypothetical protein
MGYGYIRSNCKTIKTHRLSWEIHNGPITDGLCVLHRCDRGACVNPIHLFLGTTYDNMADMVAKGRQARGERSGWHTCPERMKLGAAKHARLTEAIIKAMRHDRLSMSLPTIARKYGVGISTVWRIVTGQAWTHVAPDQFAPVFQVQPKIAKSPVPTDG